MRVEEKTKITYSDVCKDNKVYDQLREHFDIEPKEHKFSYGYMYITINGIRFSVNVDRHQTHAGNQYIRIYPDNYCRKEYKIPMNVEIDMTKIKAQLEKIANQTQQENAERENRQSYRERIYQKFNDINNNKRITLNVDYEGNITLQGAYSPYYKQYIHYDSIEKDMQEVREYFASYEKEKAEVEKIKAILVNVK